VGDLFVAVGNGQYKVYSNTGTLKETLSDGLNGGATAGCAFDLTYHLYTANLTESRVVRYAIGHPHSPLRTIDTGAASKSIVFDGEGNFYVGNVGGDLRIHKYNPHGELQATLPMDSDCGSAGAHWIDISAGGQFLFYTCNSRKIKKLNLATSQHSDFATFPGNTRFQGLRLLPPGNIDTNGVLTGGLLVATRAAILQLNGSGSTIRTFDYPNEDDWQVLTLDPKYPGRFWAGNPTTHNFHQFEIESGIRTRGAFNSGSGPFGICSYGAFSAAQPTPTIFPGALHKVSFDFPSTSFMFSDGTGASNELTLTVNGLGAGAEHMIIARASAIPPAAGNSDQGLPCTLTADIQDETAEKCVVWNLDAHPELPNSSGVSVDLKIQALHGSTSLTDMNTRLLRNEAEDVTTFVRNIDPGGTVPRFSVFSLNQVAGDNGGCAYLSPLTEGATFNSGNSGKTIPVKFKCSSIDLDVASLKPRISLVQIVPEGAPRLIFPPPPTGGTAGPSPFYRFDSRSQTWIFNLDTTGLHGSFIITTFDNSGQVSSFEVLIVIP
jgi:hypothetical protein